MYFRRSTLAAIAAVLSFEFVAVNTPASMLQSAYAQDLSSSLQFKVKKLATNINKARKSLASQGAALAGDAFKLKQFGQRIDSYANGLKKARRLRLQRHRRPRRKRQRHLRLRHPRSTTAQRSSSTP